MYTDSSANSVLRPIRSVSEQNIHDSKFMAVKLQIQ